MDQDLSQLHQLFDHFTEPVLLKINEDFPYFNESARELLPFLSCLPESDINFVVSVVDQDFCVSSSHFSNGNLFFFRPLPPEKGINAQVLLDISPKLRDYLSSLSAATEQLENSLDQSGHLSLYERPLAIQEQAIHRLFQLVRYAEFTDPLSEVDYPASMLDFVSLCFDITDEAKYLAELADITLTCTCTPSLLLTMGNIDLLRQLILALLSNALKAAGTNGSVSMTLRHLNGRAILSVKDSGTVVASDRMPGLFRDSLPERLPLSDERSALGLYVARKIVSFYHGVIMAESRPDIGS
ncbi:MAG: ATP-binding protein, partial [Evtepia sp.]